MTLDFERCRLKPFAHQIIGIEKLIENPFFALFDEMGAGKTKQVIDAAQFLFSNQVIDKVIVLTPASVRSVWFDQELGELSKHLWDGIPATIVEFHAKLRAWVSDSYTKEKPHLRWIITNYEFIRSKARLEQLSAWAGSKTLLVLDESTAVKSYRAQQSKACLQLRRACGRVVLLNGTPIANNPMDMFSQGQIMNSKILSAPSAKFPISPSKYTYFHARARYAVMGGWQQKQIIDWQNLDDMQERFKPFVLRRLKKDCLDLPAVLPPVTLDKALDEPTWKIYKQMRDDMVSWLSDTTVSMAQQAITKSLRLAQITSGFLGGVEEQLEDITDEETIIKHIPTVEEVGREKLDFTIEWMKERLVEDPNLKLLVWCRFIPELDRFLKEVKKVFPKHQIGCVAGRPLLGKTKKEERADAMRLLDPRTAPPGPVTVGGTLGTGGLGHNFTACHTTLSMSYDYSYWKKEQGDARVDRPGQIHCVSNFDVVATGPQGQKTIDHLIIKARRGKESVANWTTAAWVKALTEE